MSGGNPRPCSIGRMVDEASLHVTKDKRKRTRATLHWSQMQNDKLTIESPSQTKTSTSFITSNGKLDVTSEH
jgi:hypothetical protein